MNFIRSNRNSIPFLLSLFGRFLRETPYFRGKRRLRNILANKLQDKGYSEIISFDKGQKISLDLDDWIPFNIFLTGIYTQEKTELLYFLSSLRKGMTVLDIGANIGYYSLLAAARIAKNGKVHSFEPVRETYSRLQQNITLNEFKNMEAHRYIIHDHIGEMDIFVADKSNTGSSSLSRSMENFSNTVQKVQTITIDSYIKSKQISSVDIVKIDVEGSELFVLKGMKNLLKRDNMKIFLEINRHNLAKQNTKPQDIAHFLQQVAYHPYLITKEGISRLKVENIPDSPLVSISKKLQTKTAIGFPRSTLCPSLLACRLP
jgi:FkbM family methyltransferase